MPSLKESKAERVKVPQPDYRSCRLFLVGGSEQWSKAVGDDVCFLESEAEVLRGFAESPKSSVWVAQTPSWFSALASSFSRAGSDRRLLVLRPLQDATSRALSSWFRFVVVAGDGNSLLETSQLLDVLAAPNRDELFIGGAYDDAEKLVVLYRGSVEPLVVPASWFSVATATRAPLEFRKIAVVDHGQTIAFGDYEVAADAILYEIDEEYRKKAKKRSLAADDSLGGSIRRLRLQKGLTQSDFGLPLKTIARIERGEVRRPQTATLRKIASRLEVPVDTLGTY